MDLDIDSSPAPKISSLLLLPVELRLEIYYYLLTPTPSAAGSTSRTTLASLDIHPSILLTCRLLHQEALPILFSQNTFHAHPSLLTTFPRLLPSLSPICSPSLLPLISRVHLTFRLDTLDAPFAKEAAKASLSGLDTLTVELKSGGVFLGAGCGRLRALEEVRGVGEVNFIGSTLGFEAYLGWLRKAMMSEEGAQLERFKTPDECSWTDRFVKVNRLIVV
ncbi:hypothetical protein LIA77_01161 [Sarocladium implicatum]|nr:hypothetical protein LIA77_01161 [Sarocladium implicatum]